MCWKETYNDNAAIFSDVSWTLSPSSLAAHWTVNSDFVYKKLRSFIWQLKFRAPNSWGKKTHSQWLLMSAQIFRHTNASKFFFQERSMCSREEGSTPQPWLRFIVCVFSGWELPTHCLTILSELMSFHLLNDALHSRAVFIIKINLLQSNSIVI